MKNKELRTAKKYSLIISIAALITGAAFHGLRIHPENADGYRLGVIMGITMATLAGTAFVLFIILLIICKKSEQK